MAFAVALQASLRIRERRIPLELANGDALESVLTRDLLAVEAISDGDPITSILLLDADGRRLWHGAGPRLPRSYCDAIDGGEIGPCAGSCGTAAYLGRPIYVSDIATDPLWADYRDLALPHGLLSCWSTPIRDEQDTILGTFAIYHRTIGNPSADEVEAIAMITNHVAHAILRSRTAETHEQRASRQNRDRPFLKLVRDDNGLDACVGSVNLLLRAAKLHSLADQVENCAAKSESKSEAEALRKIARRCRKLISAIRTQVAT
jgi:GAF domain-containing protein